MAKPKRKRCVIIDDVVYESVKAVCENMNMLRSSVIYRIEESKSFNWSYGSNSDKIDVYQLPKPKRVISEETKKKLLKAITGRKMSEYNREALRLAKIKSKVNIRVLINNTCYPTIKAAHEHLKLDRDLIKKRCLAKEWTNWSIIQRGS